MGAPSGVKPAEVTGISGGGGDYRVESSPEGGKEDIYFY